MDTNLTILQLPRLPLAHSKQLLSNPSFVPGLFVDLGVYGKRVLGLGVVIDSSIGAVLNFGNK